MTDSAVLKLDRAAKHITDLGELLSKVRAFSYVVETNAETGKRATYAKKNEAAIAEVALICGDIVHNLRSALDHAYWNIVSPFASSDWDRMTIQFPFSESAAGLEKALKKRLAHRVSVGFFHALINLAPHGEPGGCELLYLIHELDILDKHKLLTPIGDYTRITGDLLRRQVPDAPRFIGNMSFGKNYRDIGWNIDPRLAATLPLEQELDVPVDVVIAVGRMAPDPRPVVPTLNKLADIAAATIRTIRDAAS